MAPPRKYLTIEQRRISRREKQAKYAENYKNQGHGHIMKAPEPEARTIVELEFARAAPRTITQDFFGDPLRGRSALDKMRSCTP